MSLLQSQETVASDNDNASPLLLSQDDASAACSHLTLIQHKLSNWLVLLSVLLLVIINVMVIFGNILVILSVFISQKLRTSTNYFIVSLAVADLLVGIAVLPYSLTLEVLDGWIFGSTWCQGWLVVDVWMCTASILNLCAISVDRYLAVTRPVQYRSLMTSSRAKKIILAVWLASFLICFPPLVGLNGRTGPFTGTSSAIATSASIQPLVFSEDETIAQSTQSTLTTLQPAIGNSTVTCQFALSSTSCKLFNEKGYVIYSALGSFWCPMAFMIFFYWRIYRVASSSTRALERGYKNTKGGQGGQGTAASDERFTLRMHRGLACEPCEPTQSQSLQQCVAAAIGESGLQERGRVANSSFLRWKSKPTIIEPSVAETQVDTRVDDVEKCELLLTASATSTARNLSIRSCSDGASGSRNRLSPSASVHSNLAVSACSSRAGSARSSAASARASRRSNAGKLQLRRLKAETKAAKTVSFIVGGFIICWVPFFTAYLVRAFCDYDCINPLLMSVFTWLGYLNSGINPIIYGLFSRDFRKSFKQIVCKCVCTPTHETGVSSLIRNIHMPTFLDEEAAK